MQKKILYILLISFFCCNFVLAGEALAVSSAVKNLGETALTGFGGAETVNISEEISDTDLNELTEKGLQNSGVIMNLSSGIGSLLGGYFPIINDIWWFSLDVSSGE
jgi:VIT1/CCC1 family predicted Fe2+/Mn2+ transporter